MIKTYLNQVWTSLILEISIAMILIKLASIERGYIAIGGEWLIILIILIWGCKYE